MRARHDPSYLASKMLEQTVALSDAWDAMAQSALSGDGRFAEHQACFWHAHAKLEKLK